MLDSPQTIDLIRLVNPFDHRERVYETLPWAADKTLNDYFPVNVLSQEYVVSINGKVFMAEDFAQTHLSPGDNIVACVVPQGGDGDSKTILRIVALIAIAVFAPYAAVALGGAAAGTVGALTAFGTALSVGISIAGGMLVNALLPPPKPSATGATNSAGSVATYGIDGAKNISAEGVPVPVSYGTFRMGGNAVGTYLVNVGTTQILYMQFAAGEGPLAAITDIEINDQPIANYLNVETMVRMGAPDQTPIPWFLDSITPNGVSLNISTAFINYTTFKSVDQFRIDMAFPAGLGQLDTAGNVGGQSVGFVIEYKKHTDVTWIPLGNTAVIIGYTPGIAWSPARTFYGPEGDPTSIGAYVPDGTEYNIGDVWYSATTNEIVGQNVQLPIYGSGVVVTDASRSGIRRSFSSPVLTNAIYDIRVKRTNAEGASLQILDTAFVTDINEIELKAVGLRNTGLVGIKVQLGSQISGLPKVTYLNHGRLIRAFDVASGTWVTSASANPAWIVLDILTNARFGGAVAMSRIDIPMFKTWAAWCDANNFTFNGVFDTSQTLWDALQFVLRMGRAQIVQVGTRYSVVIERADTPVMMFSVGNMIRGTFKNTWLPVADRANEIDVTYFDQDDKYKQKTIRIVDPVAVTDGKPPRQAAITLYGCVDKSRADIEGQLALNLNRYVLQTVEFGAKTDAIACTVGDLIYVQHDMPAWGDGGRVDVGSTSTSVVLDRQVVRTAGKSYKLLLTYDAIQRYSGTVSSVTGTGLVLSGFTNAAQVKRIKIGALDLPVLSVYAAGGGSFGVIVPDAAGITPGLAYTLWDTDVIVEADVVNDNLTSSTITMTAALLAVPVQFQNFMFGEVNKVKKPFRVKSIHGSQDYRRDIVAIEYNASVYSTTGIATPTPNYSSLGSNLVQSTIVNVFEELMVFAGSVGTRVTVHFTNDSPMYRDSIVLCSVNSAPYQVVSTGAIDRAYLDANDGDVLIFKVVARGVLGDTSPESSAPTSRHAVIGKTAPPSDITGFAVQTLSGLGKFTWTKLSGNSDLDVLIGGRVFVRWSPLTLGATWENGSLVNGDGYAGDTSIGFGPIPGTGTFFAKAMDSTGNYSKIAASFIATEALLTGFSTLATVTESPTFTGAQTNTVVVDGGLQLDTSLLIDSMGLMDGLGFMDSAGGLSLTGSYAFHAKMDLGSVKTSRLFVNIASLGFDADDLIDSRLTSIDAWDTLDGAVINDAEAKVMVRATDDDPNAAPTWGPWHDLGLVADYTARGFDFRVDYTTADPVHNREITTLSVSAKQ